MYGETFLKCPGLIASAPAPFQERVCERAAEGRAAHHYCSAPALGRHDAEGKRFKAPYTVSQTVFLLLFCRLAHFGPFLNVHVFVPAGLARQAL